MVSDSGSVLTSLSELWLEICKPNKLFPSQVALGYGPITAREMQTKTHTIGTDKSAHRVKVLVVQPDDNLSLIPRKVEGENPLHKVGTYKMATHLTTPTML